MLWVVHNAPRGIAAVCYNSNTQNIDPARITRTRALRLYRRLGFETVGEVAFRSENDSREMRLTRPNR
jgi:ribosomal protein S18 acetylase RimI-like enzyme